MNTTACVTSQDKSGGSFTFKLGSYDPNVNPFENGKYHVTYIHNIIYAVILMKIFIALRIFEGIVPDKRGIL